MKRHWTVLPNFVDCEVFRPAASLSEKMGLRREMGVPGDALVAVCVAALKCGHKRVDYVVREFLAARVPGAILILAGAATDETGIILELTKGHPEIRICQDYPHSDMPALLRLADVMVLGSLFEMMPIALLEGMATGLPVISHEHPVMTWMTGTGGEEQLSSCHVDELLSGGANETASSLTTEQLSNSTTSPPPAGMAIDMAREGALAGALAGLTPEWIAEHGRMARERAVAMFSKETVIKGYVEYYGKILKAEN